MPEEGTPLINAIGAGKWEMARFLLGCGANPNLSRPFIAAINVEPEESGLKFVKLLAEHGADVNRIFPWYGDDRISFSPLSWAEASGKTKIAAFLRSKGAVMPEKKPAHKEQTLKNIDEEVIAFFEKKVGPVQPKSLIEIVPTEFPIAIHVIPAGKDRNFITLFTSGMSDHPMKAPKGEKDYRFAELFIQLPPDWPLTEKGLSDPNKNWPITWLRRAAKYPHENQTWLGGPLAIMANGEPPEPFAPKIEFTSMLLLAEDNFASAKGLKIQLYRLTPLYTEERELEIRQGIEALVQALDKKGVSFVIDLERRNVALSRA
jgi:hypothetical protein